MATFNININQQVKEILGETVIAGDILYLSGNSKWYRASALNTSTSKTDLRIALQAGVADEEIDTLGYGYYQYTDNTVLVPGQRYNLSTDFGKATTQTYTQSVVRYVGTAFDATTMLFNPDETYIHDSGRKINEVEILTSHKHVEADIVDLDKYTKSEVNALLTGDNPSTFEQGRYEGTTFTNHDTQEIALPLFDDPTLGAIHAFKYLGQGYDSLFAASRNSTGLTRIVRFNNLDDLTDFDEVTIDGVTQFGIDEISYSKSTGKLYVVLNDPNYTETTHKVYSINPITLDVVNIINHDTGNIIGLTPHIVIGDHLYVGEGYYSGLIHKYNLVTNIHVASIDPGFINSSPHAMTTDGEKLYVSSIWDGGLGVYIARIEVTTFTVEETQSYDMGALLGAGFTDDIIVVGDYLYLPQEGTPNNGIYRVNKNNLSEFVKLEVARPANNLNIYALGYDGENVIYAGEDMIGSFNVNTRVSILYENPFSSSPNEMVIHQDRFMFAGFSSYPVTDQSTFVAIKASPFKAIKRTYVSTDGTATEEIDYATGFHRFNDFIGLGDDNGILQGAIGTVVDGAVTPKSPAGLFISHTRDLSFDVNDGGLLMSAGKVDVRGALARVDSLAGISNRAVYVNSEGTLFSLGGVNPTWIESASDIGVYAFTAGWVDIPTLSIGLPQDVTTNVLMNVVANIYITNTGTRGGYVDVGWSLNTVAPTQFKTLRVEPGFDGLVPVAFSIPTHPGFSIADVISIQIGGLDADITGTGSFTPVADGSTGTLHELVVSVPGLGSGGGDVYLAGDNVFTGANTFNQEVSGVAGTLSNHFVIKSQLEAHGLTGSIADGQVALGTATPNVLAGSVGLQYTGGELLVTGNTKITYVGGDNTATRPLYIDTSGSLQDTQPAFMVNLRNTGARKGFLISNDGDAAGWASFQYENDTAAIEPGIYLGDGSAARDVAYVRSGIGTAKITGTLLQSARLSLSNGAVIQRDEAVGDAVLSLQTSSGVNVFSFENGNSNTTPVAKMSYTGGYVNFYNGVIIRRNVTAGTSTAFSLQDSASTNYFTVLNNGNVTALGTLSITGSGSFGGNVTTIAPTLDLHAATKKYVDDTIGSASIGGSITDNQIAIGAATANTIEGSAAFTWDGTKLTLADINIYDDGSAHFSASDAGALYIDASLIGFRETPNGSDFARISDTGGVVISPSGSLVNLITMNQAPTAAAVNFDTVGDGYHGWIAKRADNSRRFAFESNGGDTNGAHFSLLLYDAVGGDAQYPYIMRRNQILFNPLNADIDTQIEGVTDSNLIFADASTDRVGIGTATPAHKLDIVGDIRLTNTVPSLLFSNVAETETAFIRMDSSGQLEYNADTGTHLFQVSLGNKFLITASETRSYTNILPDTTDTLSIGQADRKWGSGFFSGQVSVALLPTNPEHAASKQYVDDNAGGGGGSALNTFIFTSAAYSTANNDTDTDKTIIAGAGTTSYTLSGTGLTVGFRQQLFNDTGGDLTLISSDTIKGTLPAVLTNGYFAYATLTAANTWAVSVAAAGGAGGGGDVYLANSQTFTGVNTFSANSKFTSTAAFGDDLSVIDSTYAAHIKSTAATLLKIERTTNANAVMSFANTVKTWYFGASNGDGDYVIGTGLDLTNDRVFSIDTTTNNVGIGVANDGVPADAKLYVNGNVEIQPATGTAIDGTHFKVSTDAGFTSVATETIMSGKGLTINLLSPTTGWAREIGTIAIDGVSKFGFGAYGNAADARYLYFGNLYNDAGIKIADTGEVGINIASTTEPVAGGAALQVVGTGSFTGQVTIPQIPVATTDAASKYYVDLQSTLIDAWGGAWERTNQETALQPADTNEYDMGYFEVSTTSNTQEWVKFYLQFGATIGNDGHVELMIKVDEDEVSMKTVDIVGPGRADITNLRIVRDTSVSTSRRYHLLMTFDGLQSGLIYSQLGSRVGKPNITAKVVYDPIAFTGTPTATLAEINNPATSYYYPAVGYLGTGGSGGGDAYLANTQTFTGINTFSQGIIIGSTQTLRSSSNNIEVYNGSNAYMNFKAGHANANLQVFTFTTGSTLQMEIAGDTGIDMSNAVAIIGKTPTADAHLATKAYVDANSGGTTQENTDVDVGTEVVATVALATYDAVFFDYVVKNGTNMRAGRVTAVHDGTNVEYSESSTNDLGDTSGVDLTVVVNGANLELRATVTTANWIVRTGVKGI